MVFPHTGSPPGFSVVPLTVQVNAAITFNRYSPSFFSLAAINSHIFTLLVVQIFKIKLLLIFSISLLSLN